MQAINFKEVSRISSALVGVIVVVGFVSGQDLMQFFTYFGGWGMFGVLVSGALFMFLATTLATIAQQHASTSHKPVIYAICGRWLGMCVDVLIVLCLFAVTVVMLAGAGVLLRQLAGVPQPWGGLGTTLLMIFIVCLDLRRVVNFIGSITPLLTIVTAIVAMSALAQRDADWAVLQAVAVQQPQAASHWLIAAALYVAYTLVSCAPFLIIMSGQASNRRTALWGGIAGGLLLTFLILLITSGVFAQINHLGGVALPTLQLAVQLSPVLGALVGVTFFGMILNTAVGVVYSFCARVLVPGTMRFRWGAAAVATMAFLCSLVGVPTLVSAIYPVFGWLGFVLMGCTAVAYVRCRVTAKRGAPAAKSP